MTTYLEWGYFDNQGKFTRAGYGYGQTPPGDAAVYRCAGRLRAGTGRANENVEAVEVLTIDDVGTKIDRAAMQMLAPAPTDILETSPGNFQWQYVISGGMDPKTYVALRSAMKSHPVWGKSEAIAPSNLIRVALGVNGKPGPAAKWGVIRPGGSGAPWSPEALVSAFGGIGPAIAVSMSGDLEAPSDGALVALLARLPNDGVSPYCNSYEAWIEFGLALYGATAGSGVELWEDWCSGQAQGQDVLVKWNSFSGTAIGWPTLCMYEDRWGVGSRHGLAAALFDDGEEFPVEETGSEMVEAMQRTVANAIVKQYGARIRWNVTTSQWHQFEGTWKKSEFPLGYRLAKRWADGAAATLGKAALAAVSKSAFYSGVETILQADPAIAVTKDAFDRDNWLLGTPGGTVDLRTGILRASAASELISLSCSVAPALTEACPKWLGFVKWACTDPTTGRVDAGMLKMLRQWAGYCLTGDVSEEKVMFFWGGGRNGKGTFIETMQAVMGDYFQLAAKDLFMATKWGTHTEDVAALAGKRMVVADEVPTSAQWNESFLKAVSGGGSITSRHLYGKAFTFPIRFKVTIIGNEKPAFQGAINEALKRRLRLVAFLNTANPQSLTLKRELEVEAPGILRWAINGLSEMLAGPGGGLFVADSALAATDEYFNESDLFGQWLDENTEATPGRDGKAGELFSDWENWRNQQGNHNLINSHKKFKEEMVKRGKTWREERLGSVYKDLSIKSF